MNIYTKDVLIEIAKDKYSTQRTLSNKTGLSLGKINQSLQSLISLGYLSKTFEITNKGLEMVDLSKPTNAIILAAGFGMRMIPINNEIPKGLLKVHGEVLIERLINQLHQVQIQDIVIVVGFMKEKFEYLIDKYGIKLICNDQYAKKNNLHSLQLAGPLLNNTYVIPSDIYCVENPFSTIELYSWYMVSDQLSDESAVRVNRKKELVALDKELAGNQMIGIAYLLNLEAQVIKEKLHAMSLDSTYDNVFWEATLMNVSKMIVHSKVISSELVHEINTPTQLNELNEHTSELSSDVIKLIAKVFNIEESMIMDVSIMKKGMTNRSFKFKVNEKYYIIRIPGVGTAKMLNRNQEYNVYQHIQGKDLCDNILYINPESGYKITEYWDNATVCNPLDYQQVKRCIAKLKDLHALEITVDHSFDLFMTIEHYESLRNKEESIYDDYLVTKKQVFKLKEYIDSIDKKRVLSHIDAVPDNFLMFDNEVRLIDWEYAGMQDPHVDIAMFAIYALYDKHQIDDLIDMYFEEGVSYQNRVKIYCYVSVCGLLWSNWCEYKRIKGIDFGEYALRQYRYAKDFYRIAIKEMAQGK